MSRTSPIDTPGAFYRVADLPKIAAPDHQPDDLTEQVRAARAALLPVLAGAHAGNETVITAWVHPSADADLHLLVTAGTAGPSDGRAHSPLLYPPGAHGTHLAGVEGARLLRTQPCWVRCPGVIDALAAQRPDPRERPPEGVFDDYLAALLAMPFGWLIAAEPKPRAQADEYLRMLARTVPRLRELAATSEAHHVALTRAEAHFRELSRASITGLWRLHVLAGGSSPMAALRVAGLLSAAADIAHTPYRLLPGDKAADLDTAWTSAAGDGDGALPVSPFLAASDLVAALARPPVRELPGVRLTPASTFDVTPENSQGIDIGMVLDRSLSQRGPLKVSTATLNRHVFVCGATGSGKSQTVRALLERLDQHRIPWLVIEPAKAEYAGMAGRIDRDDAVLVIRPGQADVPPAGLNPLEPEPGFPLQTHLDLVRALFLAAFEPYEPLPQVLSQALTSCYTALGWNLALGESRYPHATPRYPTLGDLRSAARRTVDEIGYSDRVTSDIRGFIDVRIGSLQLGTPGRFFQGGHHLDIADLLRRNTVLELEDIGNDQDKAFFIGTILIRITEHLRQRHPASHDGPGLRHVTVIEEAHRLLKATAPGTPAAHAVELFAAMLAEIRAYGEGIVVAEQIPSKITPDVVKNTALKIVHRLPAKDDRDTVGATMNLFPRHSEYVVTLPPGVAAVFADGMDHPLLTRMPLGEARESDRAATRTPEITACRSPACGPACRKRPCTLREIEHGGELAQDPELALWIELLTASHVLGCAELLPRRGWLTRLAARADPRTLDCAIGQLAQAATNRRYIQLIEHYQPEDLASHVAEHACAWLAGIATACDGTETRWQAGRYRWADVFRTLTHGDHPRDEPHPLTSDWQRRGLDLAGLPASGQLAALRRMPASWDPDRTAIDGSGDPPEHARLAGLLSRADDPIDRLQQAVHFLDITTDWPFRRLHPREWAARQNTQGAM